MFSLSQIVFYETLLFLAALAIVVLVQILDGMVNTRYLLYGREASGKLYFSEACIQLLIPSYYLRIYETVSSIRA